MYNKQKDSKVKRDTRNKVFREIRRFITTPSPRCLTLPNLNFELEASIKRRFPEAVITSFENNWETYNEIIKSAPSYVDMKFGDILSYRDHNIFSFVWLDLCNSYTEENLFKIMNFVKNLNLKKRAILCLTLAMGRGDSDEELSEKFYPNYKNSGIIKHICDQMDYTSVEVRSMKYQCKDISPMASTMHLIILKIKK